MQAAGTPLGPARARANKLPRVRCASSATLLGKPRRPRAAVTRRRREGKGGGGAAVLSPAVSKWLKSLGVSEAAVGGITWDKILTKNKKVGPVAWERWRKETRMGGVQEPKPWPGTRCRGQSADALRRSKAHAVRLQ